RVGLLSPLVGVGLGIGELVVGVGVAGVPGFALGDLEVALGVPRLGLLVLGRGGLGPTVLARERPVRGVRFVGRLDRSVGGDVVLAGIEHIAHRKLPLQCWSFARA